MYGSVGVRNDGVFVIHERERIRACSIEARRRHFGACPGFSRSHHREGDPTIQQQPVDDPSLRGLLWRLCARR